MLYKRALVRLLDRPGGRHLLGKISTRAIKDAGGDGVEIKYLDGFWTRCVGRHFFPDSPKFDYAYTDFGIWKHQAERSALATKDHWLRHYEPREGDVAVDVGAGRGEDSLTFSRLVGETGRVIAIEAHPRSFAILKSFCRLNRLSNVTPLNVALMDKCGTVQISESPASWLEDTVQWANGAAEMNVRACTFDDICSEQGLKHIAFLKMNIEGAERYALLGMERTLPLVRHVCVACHDFRADSGDGEEFRTRAFVEKFLMNRGFTVASRQDDPRDYVRDHVYGVKHDETK